MSSDPAQLDQVSGQMTTGHEWDGIRELNTPLPRWWLWLFYLTIAFSVVYWILYPAWPLATGFTPGLLGYTNRARSRMTSRRRRRLERSRRRGWRLRALLRSPPIQSCWSLRSLTARRRSATIAPLATAPEGKVSTAIPT